MYVVCMFHLTPPLQRRVQGRELHPHEGEPLRKPPAGPSAHVAIQIGPFHLGQEPPPHCRLNFGQLILSPPGSARYLRVIVVRSILGRRVGRSLTVTCWVEMQYV